MNNTTLFRALGASLIRLRVFSFSSLTACLCLLMSATTLLYSQVPNQFSFQGVARNAEGKAIAGKSISLQVTLRSEKPEGSIVYQETQTALTNSGGIFNISIGGGNVKSGTIASIDWKSTNFFLQLEMDADGGSNFVDLGTTQLLSVPYAQYSSEASRWQNGYPVVQKFELGNDVDINDPNAANDPDFLKYQLPTVGDGDRMIWYPMKGAFRAGLSQNGRWEKDLIGTNSTAFGGNTMATGSFTTAFGFGSQATGDFSTSIGLNSSAMGGASTAIGWGSIAFGYGTISIGQNTYAKTSASTALGMYNDASDVPDDVNPLPKDRIFQIGNGNAQQRSNALTVLRNGFMGIGQGAIEPEFLLDVSGRARIRNNGETAGIYFNNAANDPSGFVGMVNDNQIGFFVGGSWKFFLNANGNASLSGALTQNSDRRLKRDIALLTPSLGKITTLQGYHYFWKDNQKDQSLQTGLIAQEVETVFPELVTTDSEGYKSGNYIGLIPHMVESIKELKAEIEMLKRDRR